MAEETNYLGVGRATSAHLEHSAFTANLPAIDVLSRFWTELNKILPVDEMHVIEPYALDAGGEDAATYAGTVVALLKPALHVARRMVVIHGKPREGIRELLEQNISVVNTKLEVEFQRGNEMHARYLIADRSRALRMEFSFNRIGRSFGTLSLVEGVEDLAGIVEELERLHPSAAG